MTPATPTLEETPSGDHFVRTFIVRGVPNPYAALSVLTAKGFKLGEPFSKRSPDLVIEQITAVVVRAAHTFNVLVRYARVEAKRTDSSQGAD